MSLIDRIKRLAAGSIDDKLKGADNPEETVRALIVTMQGGLQEARIALAAAVKDVRSLDRESQAAQREVERWHQNARQALGAGKDSLAREALKRKKESEQFAASLATEGGRLRAELERLKTFFFELEARLREAQTRERLLLRKKRRLKRAELLQERFPQHKREILRQALEGLETEVDHQECVIRLEEEDPLERKFRLLEEDVAREVQSAGNSKKRRKKRRKP